MRTPSLCPSRSTPSPQPRTPVRKPAALIPAPTPDCPDLAQPPAAVPVVPHGASASVQHRTRGPLRPGDSRRQLCAWRTGSGPRTRRQSRKQRAAQLGAGSPVSSDGFPRQARTTHRPPTYLPAVVSSWGRVGTCAPAALGAGAGRGGEEGCAPAAAGLKQGRAATRAGCGVAREAWICGDRGHPLPCSSPPYSAHPVVWQPASTGAGEPCRGQNLGWLGRWELWPGTWLPAQRPHSLIFPTDRGWVLANGRKQKLCPSRAIFVMKDRCESILLGPWLLRASLF